jgi:predicted phage tail protein
MEKVRTIKLSGSLAHRFGRVHRLAVANAAEAIRALCAMKPGFEKFLMEAKDNGLTFAVFQGKKNVSEDELKNPAGDDIIRIVPVIAGSKKGGVLQVIAGVVLVAVGMVVQWYLGGAPNPISNYLYGAGISMIVGGVVQMLTPVPKNQTKQDDDRKSYIFNGAANVQAQGNCVPVLYGELIVGSVVASAGISTEDNYVIPTSASEYGYGVSRDGGSMYGNVIDRSKDNAQ